MQTLKNKKACGVDKISSEMIKSSIYLLSTVYRKLFNIVINSGFFPESWSLSIITPIFKAGVRNDPCNCGGICVSGCLGKFFCSILNERLINYYDKNNIIHQSQIGFRPGFRTIDHIFTLRTLVDKYVNTVKQGKIYACFVNFKKAFDRVWHNGLLHKLLLVGIGCNFFNVIKDMYSKTRCCIKLNSSITSTFNYNRGVGQGYVLSPALFNLFLNDLPLQLNCPEVDPFLLPDGTKLSCLLYADDLVLLSHSQQGLQNSLDKLSTFCEQWKVQVNLKKTRIMVFQKKCRKSFNPSFSYKKDVIQKVNDYTYLGIKITSTGSFALAEETLKEKALRALYGSKRLLNFSILRLKIVEKLFDTLVKPIVLYNSEVLGCLFERRFRLMGQKSS